MKPEASNNHYQVQTNGLACWDILLLLCPLLKQADQVLLPFTNNNMPRSCWLSSYL